MSAGPDPADLRVWHDAAGPVHRWGRALDDLLGAVAVAGLAWPDADLAVDLRALAEEGARLGATEGAGRLDRFAVAAESVREAPPGQVRSEAEGLAFEALMELVGWSRRLRRELDLVEVQAALVVRGTSEAVVAPPRGALTSGTWGVVGAELLSDKLAIHAVDLDRGTPLLLLDRLEDVDPGDPCGRRVVSRLFQARVALGQVLAGAIGLKDHPVGRSGAVEVVRPAFDAVAVARPLAGPAPRAPALVVGAEGPRWPAQGAPARVELALGREGERIVVRAPAGIRVEVPETAVMRYTLTKLALRDGAQLLDATVGVRQANAALLSVDHPLHGRSFPAIDPRAFPLSAADLLGRIAATGPGADWLRATLSRELGTVEPGLTERLVQPPTHLEDAFWRGRGLRVLGLDLPASHTGFAAQALPALTTPRDRWMAVWLLLADDEDPVGRSELERVWRAHLQAAPGHPEGAELAARAALIPLFPASDEPDATPRAVAWLDAHLDALRGRARRSGGLPRLDELTWLAEVRVLLTGDRSEAPLAALDLPADALRSEAMEALWSAFTTDGDLAAAGDAVWAMRLVGAREQLWGPG